MEWISVKDELPKEHKWVILASVQYQVTTFRIFMDGIFVNPDLDYFEIKFITHWMPLPKPPVEQEEEWGGIVRCMASDGRNVNMAEELNRLEKELIDGVDKN